jgi:hypothetical protein
MGHIQQVHHFNVLKQTARGDLSESEAQHQWQERPDCGNNIICGLASATFAPTH